MDDKAQARKGSIAGLLVIDGYSFIGVKGLPLSVLRFLPSKGLESCSICSVKNSSIRSSCLRYNKRRRRLVDAAKKRP